MKPAHRLAAFLVTAFPVTLGFPAISHAEAPPDVLELRDGSFLRGTVVERLAGQHVVFQLVTGERRTYPIADVAYAGPSEARPDAPPPTLVVPPVTIPPPPLDDHAMLTVATAPTLRANPGRYTLQVVTGSATTSVWSGRSFNLVQLDTFAPLCTAPCAHSIPRGSYYFGVSRNDGGAVRAPDGPFTIDRDLFARIDYTDRSGLRLAGWLTFGASLTAGLLMVVVPFGIAIGGSSHGTDYALGVPLAGLGVTVVGLAVGLPLIAQRDQSRIEFSLQPFAR